MDPKQRRQMLVRAGLADPIPSIEQLRAWEYIDDRVPPDGEADGQFDTHVQWVNKAASWIGYTGARCYDSKDRRCRNGGDMKRAHDEGAFPVRWYWPERFPPPIIPSVQIMRVRSAVATAGAAGILYEELRARPGMKKISRKKIAEALEGRATHNDGRWTMTPEGVDQTKFEIEQGRRASYVRN